MPFRLNMEVQGVRQVLQAGRKMVQEDSVRITAGLDLWSQIVYDISQQLVPVDTGDLKKSGRIEEASGRGLWANSLVEYGGPDAPYAWIVHNDLSAYHAPPTQALYLSHAVELAYPELQRVMRRAIVTNVNTFKAG